MKDERFWREKVPEWRESFHTNRGKCTATGMVYLRYPVYCCPGLDPTVRRPLSQRLFTRPWHPLQKSFQVADPHWIFEEVLFGKTQITVLLASPAQVKRIEGYCPD